LCPGGNREIMSPATAPLEDAMDVGVQMVFASYGWSGVSDGEVWDEELRLARLAADLGFDVLWSVEHHFNDYSFCPTTSSSCPTWRQCARMWASVPPR
jgi:hypothetical protein